MHPARPYQHRSARLELDTADELATQLAASQPPDLSCYAVQAVDLAPHAEALAQATVEGAIFIGCRFRDTEQQLDLVRRGAGVFPPLDGIPYDPYRPGLYTVSELMAGEDEGGYPATLDFRVYAHFDRARSCPGGVPLREQLAQRLHDHAIDVALEDVLREERGAGVVAIMGGHGTRRSDPYFRKVAHLGWSLARAGYFVATGGGPGIMEAGNLGPFFSNYSEPRVLDEVITTLSAADRFDGGEEEGTPAYLEAIKRYFRRGRQVLETYSGEVDPEVAERFGRERTESGKSLAIPTWFYGHEPSNLWSTHIAKYFSNSLREDGLLAIATAGVIYAPGSAGTMQEVFMDLAQNHYATFRFRSPMVFLGETRWRSLVGLIREFVANRGMSDTYGDLIHLTDDPGEAVEFIRAHPPRERPKTTPLYELI